jgi:hypothetical protein
MKLEQIPELIQKLKEVLTCQFDLDAKFESIREDDDFCVGLEIFVNEYKGIDDLVTTWIGVLDHDTQSICDMLSEQVSEIIKGIKEENDAK